MYKAGIAGDIAPPAVFVSLVGRPRMLVILADMDQEDSCSGIYKAGISGYSAPRAVFSSLVRWPMFFNITAAMDPMDSCDIVPMFRLQITAESPQLQSVQVVDILFVPQRQIPMVQAIRQTTVIPQLLFDFRWSMPFVVQVEQVHFPVVAQRQVPWSKLLV